MEESLGSVLPSAHRSPTGGGAGQHIGDGRKRWTIRAAGTPFRISLHAIQESGVRAKGVGRRDGRSESSARRAIHHHESEGSGRAGSPRRSDRRLDQQRRAELPRTDRGVGDVRRPNGIEVTPFGPGAGPLCDGPGLNPMAGAGPRYRDLQIFSLLSSQSTVGDSHLFYTHNSLTRLLFSVQEARRSHRRPGPRGRRVLGKSAATVKTMGLPPFDFGDGPALFPGDEQSLTVKGQLKTVQGAPRTHN